MDEVLQVFSVNFYVIGQVLIRFLEFVHLTVFEINNKRKL
jgi:hypothetical protein